MHNWLFAKIFVCGGEMRKIAVLAKTWSNNYFKDMMSGIQDFIKDTDICVDVFNAYDIGSSALRSLNELAIHSFPVADQYEGLIIFMNSDGDNYELDNIIDSFISLNKPIVSMDRKIKGLPFVGIDNYASEYKMVEHMITEHNCKTFQYVGGIENFFDNKERYRALTDCLKQYDLELDPRYVSHHSFMEYDGANAFERIKSSNLPMPDAVVCANDNMAVGYCRAAEASGKIAPDDYALCGFDNIGEGQNHYPSITSVNKNIARITRESLRMIIEASHGARLPEETLLSGYIKINDSCGCNKDRDIIESYKAAITESKNRDRADQQQRDSKGAFCSCNTFEDLQSALKFNEKEIGLYETAVYIKEDIYRLNKNMTNLCYSENMMSYTASAVKYVSGRKNTIPAEWKERKEKIFVYSTLYFDHDILGYCVMPYVEEMYEKRYHEQFIDSISIAVENIRQRLLIESMNKKFKELYVIDQMTGLYNRFGYSAMAGKIFSENKGRIYIVYVDVDNLKVINDKYGHDMGDLAIKGAAQCIRKAFDDTELHVRMGGDEFLIMGGFTDEESLKAKEELTLELMQKYAVQEGLPLNLEASIGHSFNVDRIEATELELLLKAADKNMYEIKQHRKSIKNKK